MVISADGCRIRFYHGTWARELSSASLRLSPPLLHSLFLLLSLQLCGVCVFLFFFLQTSSTFSPALSTQAFSSSTATLISPLLLTTLIIRLSSQQITTLSNSFLSLFAKLPLLQLPPPLFIRPVYSVFLALHCLPPNLASCLLHFFCGGVTGSRVGAGYGCASVGESGLKQAAVVCLLTSHKQSPSNPAQRGAGEVLANRAPPPPTHLTSTHANVCSQMCPLQAGKSWWRTRDVVLTEQDLSWAWLKFTKH